MSPRLLLIDNYDSFTYNLVQYLASLGAECDVRLNDRTTAEEIFASRPDGILLARPHQSEALPSVGRSRHLSIEQLP